MKSFRNLSFAFLLVTLAVAKVFADESCGPILQGGCQQCLLTSYGYAYYGCPEGCGANSSICASVCDGEDICDSETNGTSGSCHCNYMN